MAIRTHDGLSLEARNLRAGFVERGRAPRQVIALQHLCAQGGSQIGICGPSGSGKTTLIHLLAGLERPWRGVVRWGDVAVTALSERAIEEWRRDNVGLVFQQFHVFPGMSALENVLLPLRFDRWFIEKRMRARALKLLDRVGVRSDAEVGTLCRGERQRVAMARALLRKPSIVLADEPTASLDRDTANVIADLLSTMCRGANATLVVTTDDPSLANRFDAVYDLAGGHWLRRSLGSTQRPLRTAA